MGNPAYVEFGIWQVLDLGQISDGLRRNLHPPTPAAATVGVAGERDRWELSFWHSLDVRFSLMFRPSSHSCGCTSVPPTKYFGKMCPKLHLFYRKLSSDHERLTAKYCQCLTSNPRVCMQCTENQARRSIIQFEVTPLALLDHAVKVHILRKGAWLPRSFTLHYSETSSSCAPTTSTVRSLLRSRASAM